MAKKILRNRVKCLVCGVIIESKSRHDFVMCKCSNKTFVDGGLDYCRVGGKDLDKIEVLSDKIEVPDPVTAPTLTEVIKDIESAIEKKSEQPKTVGIPLGLDGHAAFIEEYGLLAQYCGCGKLVKYEINKLFGSFACNPDARCFIAEKAFDIAFAPIDARDGQLIQMFGDGCYMNGNPATAHNLKVREKYIYKYLNELLALQSRIKQSMRWELIPFHLDEPISLEGRDALVEKVEEEFKLEEGTDELYYS